MFRGIDFGSLTFAEPAYLWLLVGPVLLLLVWLWRVISQRGDIRHFERSRVMPIRQRHALAGDLAFWAWIIIASASCAIALARPQAQVTIERQTSADIVILQDGSASMYVTDVAPNRWQRSVKFLRTFAETLGWRGDRVALALFAQLAAPQVRLTRDPNALFFFLDHLGEHSPFRLEDNPTWDTNIEEGIYWGLKIVREDERMSGKKLNPKAFVVITDGQAWSGDVAKALTQARTEGVLVYVVGVGTTQGDFIPEPPNMTSPSEKIRATLDRNSLLAIARGGGGQYFEIGNAPDSEIATQIITTIKQRAPDRLKQDTFEDLYAWFLWGAAACLCLGALVLRRPAELWQTASVLLASLALASMFMR